MTIASNVSLKAFCICVRVLLLVVLQVILYTQQDVVERVKELTGGKGVKVVFDGGASRCWCWEREETQLCSLVIRAWYHLHAAR